MDEVVSAWGVCYTLLETNMAPESGWLDDEFPSGKLYFQGLCWLC